MWSPDVYQGAPTRFTAFLSVASNAAASPHEFAFSSPAFRDGEGGAWSFAAGVEWPQVILLLSMTP